MSEIASVVERARKAFATVARLEDAITRAPLDRSLHLNLAAMNKMATDARQQLMRLSEINHIEVCNYRLMPAATNSYGLAHVSRSFLEYQNLFSQIHDALRNGAKENAIVGREAMQESVLEFAYSYSGSLGVALLAASERDFFSGKLDQSIDALYQVFEIKQRGDVREIADKFGKAVVKRIYNWSDANIKGGFSTDVSWARSDGRKLGQVVERESMSRILFLVSEASDEKTNEIVVDGLLVGSDVMSGTFHFVVPNGESYKGSFASDFVRPELTLDRKYRARIREIVKEMYATDKIIQRHELLSLAPIEEQAA
jgi:hypothetical protein